MKFFDRFFSVARGVIELLGLYESSRFRRGLDEENRHLRESLQMERMRNLSMEGQVSMGYSLLSQIHEENREFHKMVMESSQIAEELDSEEENEGDLTLEERISNLEEILTTIPLEALDKEDGCSCNCRGVKPLPTDLEKALPTK